jgi:translation initiation factor IF-1
MSKQKEDVINLMGKVVDVLPGTMFKVKLDDIEDKEIVCYLSGKMRQFKIKVLLGDKVEIEMSPYDLDKGRIIHRHK